MPFSRLTILSNSPKINNVGQLIDFRALKSINCPTLFIFGELDKMVNLEKGKKFAELIPNSKTHIIKDCGHMIMFEKAFEMREKISEFLKK